MSGQRIKSISTRHEGFGRPVIWHASRRDDWSVMWCHNRVPYNHFLRMQQGGRALWLDEARPRRATPDEVAALDGRCVVDDGDRVHVGGHWTFVSCFETTYAVLRDGWAVEWPGDRPVLVGA